MQPVPKLAGAEASLGNPQEPSVRKGPIIHTMSSLGFSIKITSMAWAKHCLFIPRMNRFGSRAGHLKLPQRK